MYDKDFWDSIPDDLVRETAEVMTGIITGGTEMRFYNIELNQTDAAKFSAYLKENGFYYESSSCYSLIHFEVKLCENQVGKVDQFLDTL